MAIPANPTVASIVTQALKRGGRTNPSADQITEATDNALQEVKADIMFKAPTHPALLVTATTVTTKGQQRYALPSDANLQHSIYSLNLLDGPDEYRGSAQGAGPSTITLASSFSASEDDLVGKYIIITGGAGAEEYREILAYNNSTKVATVDLAWVSGPTAASTYLIVTREIPLLPLSVSNEFDAIESYSQLGSPQFYATFGEEFLLYPVPMRSTYGLKHRYWIDLDKIDEAGTEFVRLLRKWRSLWIQGIAVKTMQRFDEDRYQSELQVYNFMLDTLASQTCTVTEMRRHEA